MELAQLGVSIGGLQPARVLLEGVEAQRALPLGEIRQAQGVAAIARRERSPQEARMQVHEGFHGTAFLNRGAQRQRIHAEDAHF